MIVSGGSAASLYDSSAKALSSLAEKWSGMRAQCYPKQPTSSSHISGGYNIFSIHLNASHDLFLRLPSGFTDTSAIRRCGGGKEGKYINLRRNFSRLNTSSPFNVLSMTMVFQPLSTLLTCFWTNVIAQKLKDSTQDYPHQDITLSPCHRVAPRGPPLHRGFRFAITSPA